MPYRLPKDQLILASASPARRKMLVDAGLDITVMAAAIDEASFIAAAAAENMSGVDAATLLAEMKARKVSITAPGALIIASDQLLVCGDDWLSKPESKADAMKTLRLLSGRTHQLVTAAVLYQHGQRVWHHVERPNVSIRKLDEDDIKTYLDAMGDDIYKTPGVYMIEGLGAQIISNIDGCPYAVLGLPLLHLLSCLRMRGLKLFEHGQ